MMGFLNKAMDALGVSLEEPVASEVNGAIGPSGWEPGQHMRTTVLDADPPGADSLLTRLSVVRYAPGRSSSTRGEPRAFPTAGPPSASSCGDEPATPSPSSRTSGTAGPFALSPP